MLVELGFFKTEKTANKCLLRLYRKKVLGFRKWHECDDGQMRYFYAKYQTANVDHDFHLMKFLLKVQVKDVRTGRFVDSKTKPDAELILDDGYVFPVEVDMGSEGLPQWKKQIDRYDRDVLVIALTEERMRGLMSQTTNERAWFTTNITTPHEHVWTNVRGQTAAIPRATGAML